MVFVLGVNLPDAKLARIALTAFYGIGKQTAERVCARLLIHKQQRMGTLTQHQLTALASFLSSPSTSSVPPQRPLAPPSTVLGAHAQSPSPPQSAASALPEMKDDPLRKLNVENELLRIVRENIAHKRMIGCYVGRRHAMGLPVRGQNTRNNALNAKKFNRVMRAR